MKTQNVTFYNYSRSSASYRVRIALGLKGLMVKEIADVDLRAGVQSGNDYRRISPFGLVPSFDFGEFAFSQSLALIEWLDVEHPQPRLVPEDPVKALSAREIAYAIACDIHPLNNLRVLKYLAGPLGMSETQKDDWYAHWVARGFEGIEERLRRYDGDGDYCLGADLTIADICLVPQVFNARRFNVDLGPYPRIRTVNAACNTLPAFAAAQPHEA